MVDPTSLTVYSVHSPMVYRAQLQQKRKVTQEQTTLVDVNYELMVGGE